MCGALIISDPVYITQWMVLSLSTYITCKTQKEYMFMNYNGKKLVDIEKRNFMCFAYNLYTSFRLHSAICSAIPELFIIA